MPERILYHYPIVHSQSEMGAFSETIRKVTLEKLGERVWRRKVALIGKLWHGIEESVDALALDYTRTRVYQDGLPVCGKESEIVSEIARLGSPNHQLLLRLQARGAAIMGTESPNLLLEEYALLKKVLQGKDAKEVLQAEAMHEAASNFILKKRDTFIAARIGETLQVGETGVLFLGILHDLSGLLPAGIQVQLPINMPSHRREE
ncbi:MAG: hypothetical protein Q8N53_15690 [Longimicrobiales bacterium]|nr:hypothetical protein [Longimicrobiales bacterium]